MLPNDSFPIESAWIASTPKSEPIKGLGQSFRVWEFGCFEHTDYPHKSITLQGASFQGHTPKNFAERLRHHKAIEWLISYKACMGCVNPKILADQGFRSLGLGNRCFLSAARSNRSNSGVLNSIPSHPQISIESKHIGVTASTCISSD
jgi:hypothetical protein